MTETEKNSIIFGTKAETLNNLRLLVKKSIICEPYIFTFKDWKESKEIIIKEAIKKFGTTSLIVRSSSSNEDSFYDSKAGKFLSIPNISLDDNEKFMCSVNNIFESYDDVKLNDQIFLQKYIKNVDISGVVFTKDKDTFAPYITINYEENCESTDSITSGKSENHKTIVIYREYKPTIKDIRIRKIYESICEIEQIINCDSLDIEFCYKDDQVFILQVRPISLKNKKLNCSDINKNNLSDTLQQINEQIKQSIIRRPYLYGNETAYGIMPDWNPAEMIGVKPRPLALSLYRELITDNIWAYQRDNYGYKNLRSFPLMISFAGHPYIDIRVDFNSFVPKALDDSISDKLVNFYINKLKMIPTSHDKVEFDIIFSCYSFDIDERLKELLKNGFVQEEIYLIKNALLDVTNNIINGLYFKDKEKILKLETRRIKLMNGAIPDIEKIYWLVEDCKRYGTLPFAGLARAAFIAMQFLDSLVNVKIISLEDKNFFLKSINTCAKKLSKDISRLSNQEITLNEFLTHYGHLRPGTYDILSESYSENPHLYFDFKKEILVQESSSDFFFSQKIMGQIDLLLKEQGLNIDAKMLFNFIKDAIESREYAKFEFTKNVNQILILVKKFGADLGLSVEQMSFIEIGTLMKFYSNIAFLNKKESIQNDIERNRTLYEKYTAIKLPHIIFNPEEVYCFYINSVSPNYITLEKISAETVVIDSTFARNNSITGKIIFIESADPGFDWIFSHQIGGLITKYGGINSHMAIRSAEMNIPAVIGCGQINFQNWKKASVLSIDCLNKQVVILQ